MTIRKATEHDAAVVAALAVKLWQSHTVEDLTAEFAVSLASAENAVFLLLTGGNACGFAQCGLRHDYVEGASDSPVGYLEGIFLEPDCRRKGNAKRLLEHCEAWARENGCSELASDCEIGNSESLAFHRKCGFSEVNRIVCFTKTL